MRKFFKLSLLAFFATVVSCEDATDIIQDSELSDENAFRTLSDLQQGLNGVYNAYTPDAASNGIGDAFFFSDVFTDNVKKGANNNGQGSEEYSFTLQPGSNSARIIYGTRYATINFANRILRAWNRIAPGLSDAEMDDANRIKGELLAMRALAHFDVLQYYVEDYNNDNSPGIQILNFVPEINQTVPRSTVAESFAFINADLNEANTLLEDFTPGTDIPFFVNEDVVKAIRAKVALYEGNYTLAETLSAELVADYGVSDRNEPDIPSEQSYVDMWEDANLETSEAIFVLSRLQGDDAVAANWYTNTVDRNGQVLLDMSRQLYDLYGEWDIRGRGWGDGEGVFVDEDSDPTIDLILIGKYPGGNSRGQLINHIKLIRGAEMLLIRAECEARRGAYAQAQASIQRLWNQRERTGFDAPVVPTLNSLTQSLTLILEERRKEFAFEGHRYLDVKRLGRETNYVMTRSASDCASFGTSQCAIPAADYRFTMPIPSTEVNANPTIQQNTGY